MSKGMKSNNLLIFSVRELLEWVFVQNGIIITIALLPLRDLLNNALWIST